MPSHHAHSFTTRGRRSHNEDAVLLLTERVASHPVTLVGVADGMGGEACGEVASAIAHASLDQAWTGFLEALAHALQEGERALDTLLRQFLHDAFLKADQLIGSEAQERSAEGMGTTLSVGLAVGPYVLAANVGDSRVYVVSRDHVEQLTEDDSVVADAVRRGAMSESEALQSPFRHALTRSLDGSGDAAPTLYPEDGLLRLSGSSFLCAASDGLTGVLTETELCEHLVRTGSVEDASRSLVTRAYQLGSTDNISVSVVEVGEVSREQPFLPVPGVPSEPPPGEESRQASARDEENLLSNRAKQPAALTLFVVLLIASLGALLFFLYGGGRSTEPGIVFESPQSVSLANPDEVALAWELRGGATADYEFAVTVFAPPRGEGQAPDSIQLLLQTPQLTLDALREAWPGNLETSPSDSLDYRVRVVAVSDRDTVRSDRLGSIIVTR